MADFEVHIDLDGRTRPAGLARSNRVRGTETIIFEYVGEWLNDPDRFSLEPALALGRGAFAPPAGLVTYGSIGDSAPDSWGRRLMQRAERRFAEREGRAVRTLLESDYLLGVADETRLGALRFRWVGDNLFQAPVSTEYRLSLRLAACFGLRSAFSATRKPTKISNSFSLPVPP